MTDKPGGNSGPPAQVIAILAHGASMETGALMNVPTAGTWLGLRELVGSDAARELFDIATQAVSATMRAESLN